MTATATDEAGLVARARDGDQTAFADLVRAHHSAAHRVAVLLGAGAEADDVVQDAFVRAHAGLSGFKADAAFRPWLLRIVANLVRNLHRSRGRRRDVLARFVAHGPPADEPEQPEALVLADERQRALWSALWLLPDTYRQVLGCRYVLDLSEEETAHVLAWPKGTVKSRAARALKRLRAQLEDEVDRG
ncbi:MULTISPECIES: RNA polymerase sigma factor [unclassified Saccharothrix]|uniref:RNA polymerase sigma factor n=1 Tax=unclassified Saccharothrix TaxID=2593673 RepID=UPI00307FC286